MKPLQQILFASLSGLLLLTCTARRAAALGEVDSLSLTGTTGYIESALIDSSQTFALFSSNDRPGQVRKVRLSDFTPQDFLTLSDIDQSGSHALMDPFNRFAYFASTTTPLTITKVDLSNVAEAATLQLPGFTGAASGLIDTSGTFAYYGTTGTVTSLIVKVRLADMTLADLLLLPSDEMDPTSAVLDPVNEFAYFGTATRPGRVIKIDLSTFAKVGTLTMSVGEDALSCAVLSTSTGYAYFGSSASAAGMILRVRLSDFTERPRLDLSSAGPLTSAVIDGISRYAYFGTTSSPGKVVRIRLSDFSQDATATSSRNALVSAAIDNRRGYAYFGAATSPGSVVKIDLSDARTGPPVIVTQPSGQVGRPGGTVTFSFTPGGSAPFTYQWLRNGLAIPGATSAAYTTPPLTLEDDGASYQCVVTNSLGSATTAGAIVTVTPVIKVFPNPWRSDRHGGVPITFEGIVPNSTIKIFTLSMHWVKTIEGSNPLTWDRTNDAGQQVASGYYFFLVTTSNERQTVQGKFALIK